MTLKYCFLIVLLAYSGSIDALKFPSLHFPNSAESDLVIFPIPLKWAPHFYSFIWSGKENALSYIVRVFRIRDNVMVKEIRNIQTKSYNVTGLQSGTQYAATVAALYMDQGHEEETPQSPRFPFATSAECTNGKVYTECSAHCVATCGDPNPVCSRVCRSGCGCPTERPIWHGGKCVKQSACPPAVEFLSKPQNARIVSIESDVVIVSWDPVPHTKAYKIKVSDSATGEVVQTVTSFPPIASVSNLEAGTSYKFAISTVPEEPQFGGFTAPPSISSVDHISESSFRVTWEPRSNALVYAFLLYDENRELLMVKKNMEQISIVVQRLSPGAIYYFSVASGFPIRYGELSQQRQVTTLGESSNNENSHAVVITVTTAQTTASTPISTSSPEYPQTLRCRQLYESVSNFNAQYPDKVALELPECDENGDYVTTKCNTNNVCWCVDSLSGDKIPGSNYGSQNSRFNFNCDRVGTLNVLPLELRARNLSTTSLALQWNSVEGVRGYVLLFSDRMREPTVKSIHGASSNSYELQELHPGQTYKIGVFAVDNNGVTSPVSYIETSTALLESPNHVVVTNETPNSVTLNWRYSARAEGFDVAVISLASNTILRTYNIAHSTITIDNLEPSRYIIKIREIVCDIRCNQPAASVLVASEPVSVEINLRCSLPVVDVLFAFDTSANSNLEGQKRIANAIIENLPPLTKQTGTRIGAITYNRNPKYFFNYNRFRESNRNEMIEDIEQLRASSVERTRTGLMLNYVNARFFNPRRSEAYRTRNNVKSVFIVFSGSTTSNNFGFQRVTTQLKEKSTVMVVKMNSLNSDHSIFEQMANSPNTLFDASGRTDYDSVATLVFESFCSLNERD